MNIYTLLYIYLACNNAKCKIETQHKSWTTVMQFIAIAHNKTQNDAHLRTKSENSSDQISGSLSVGGRFLQQYNRSTLYVVHVFLSRKQKLIALIFSRYML